MHKSMSGLPHNGLYNWLHLSWKLELPACNVIRAWTSQAALRWQSRCSLYSYAAAQWLCPVRLVQLLFVGHRCVCKIPLHNAYSKSANLTAVVSMCQVNTTHFHLAWPSSNWVAATWVKICITSDAFLSHHGMLRIDLEQFSTWQSSAELYLHLLAIKYVLPKWHQNLLSMTPTTCSRSLQ